MKRLLLALSLVLLGCIPPEPPLRVGISPWPPTEIVKLAEHLGYLEGVNVSIVGFSSPAELGRAYLTGGLDVAALTVDYLLHYNRQRVEHQAFLVVDESYGADGVVSQNPITSLDEVAGLRIGLEPGPLGGHVLSSFLNKAGLTYRDVEMVFVEMPDQLAAFTNKRVDMMVSYEPALSWLRHAGAHEVFSSREIPGEIVDVFVARIDTIETRQSDLQAFTSAWFSALQDYERNPVVNAGKIAPGLGITADEYVSAIGRVRIPTLADNRRMLGSSNDVFRSQIGRYVDSVNALTESTSNADLREFLTDKALPPERTAATTAGTTRN